jgi:hypothetical protein
LHSIAHLNNLPVATCMKKYKQISLFRKHRYPEIEIVQHALYLHFLLSFQSSFIIFLQIQHNKKCDSIQCTYITCSLFNPASKFSCKFNIIKNVTQFNVLKCILNFILLLLSHFVILYSIFNAMIHLVLRCMLQVWCSTRLMHFSSDKMGNIADNDLLPKKMSWWQW